jgi:C-terminal processing protease CtpA/Prc
MWKERHFLHLKFFFIVLFCFLLVFPTLSQGAEMDVGEQELPLAKRLATFGKVWGILKYFHPDVAAGDINWDGVLMEAIPRVKAASDFVSFNQELHNLIVEAGDVNKVEANSDASAYPNEELFKWLKQDPILDETVSEKLQLIQKKYTPAANAYYSYTAEGVPTFYTDTPYYWPLYPDEEHRLLALFRYWNIINYFFPYKDLIDEDWDDVLEEFVQPVIDAANDTEFVLTIKELTTRIDDTHTFLWNFSYLRFLGPWYAPAEVAYIDGKTVVVSTMPPLLQPAGGLQVGDVILKCRNMAIDDFRDSVYKYARGSNEMARQHKVNAFITRSPQPVFPFTVERSGSVIDVEIQGVTSSLISQWKQTHPAEKWKILPGNIGYVDLSLLLQEDVDVVMPQLLGTRAIVFDLRGYPNGTMHMVVNYLAPRPKRFTKIQYPVKNVPGSFYMDKYEYTGTDNPDYYRGKVVILVNEKTISQSEFTCMVFQIAPDVTIIGSQTAGADGDTVAVNLPGAIFTYFSGLGIYYPNGHPTQQIGIVPDIYCRPTIAGIRLGRDEVLERAIEFVESSK